MEFLIERPEPSRVSPQVRLLKNKTNIYRDNTSNLVFTMTPYGNKLKTLGGSQLEFQIELSLPQLSF